MRNGQRYPAASISGNLDAEWQEEVVPIVLDRSFIVLFEAETGTSQHTYIALDDVSFTPVSLGHGCGALSFVTACVNVRENNQVSSLTNPRKNSQQGEIVFPLLLVN